MMQRRRHRRARSGAPGDGDPGFQIAPMIDVVFVVLVFFMALAAQIRVERDLSLRLPGLAQPGGKALPDEEHVVTVGSAGEIRFNDEPCDGPESPDLPGLRALLARLRSVLAPLDPAPGPDGSAGLAVVIASDPESRYERTIAVLDALAAAGIQRVSLAGEEGPE